MAEANIPATDFVNGVAVEKNEPPPRKRSTSLTKKRTIKSLAYDDRKNSSSDLHSRLKTRKVLGVGEIRDDGDIYRSKISQILGHSEHLYVKLPKGLFYWQATNVAYFFGSGLLCLLLPQVATSLEMVYFTANSLSADSAPIQWHYFYLPVRFYGSALIGIGILYRGLMVTRERTHTGSGLFGCSVLFGLQTLISLPSVWSNRDHLSYLQMFVFSAKILLGVVGNYVYYEIACSSSSSSMGLLRLLRRFGLSLSPVEYTGGARTPAQASTSSYNIANDLQQKSNFDNVLARSQVKEDPVQVQQGESTKEK